MKKNNKKTLYESIMISIAKEVKKALNEYEGWTTTTTLDATIRDEDQSDSDFVDLGLSVKWAKYNLGAKPGKSAKDWYGDYYAWGETESKSKYEWKTYIFGSSVPFNKYDIDDKIVLESVDDITTATNPAWRMPTKEELEELINYTKNYWVNNYNNILGLNGRVFIGKNGNQLFIPAAGYREGSLIYDIGSDCALWSSNLSLGHPSRACNLSFYSDFICMNYSYRCYGFSIRPVC